MTRFSHLLAALVALLVGSTASAQGVLIDHHHWHRLPRPWVQPQPQTEYKIKSLAIQARLKDQVAQVQVSQTFVNTGSAQMEVQFVFPLPYDGAIDRLTLLVDGEEWPAELLPADKARERYEEIVRKSKDPALLEWMGNGLFQTSVFPVPAGKERTVSLHYNQLLRKDQGVTDFLFPLSTAKYSVKPVEKLEVNLTIESSVAIRNVYSPTHEIDVKHSGKKTARVSVTLNETIPTSDFRLFFDVNPSKLATSVLSYKPEAREDGFFLLLTTPQVPDNGEQVAKTVVFVVDKSGSMSGKKIEQAKSALKFVLNNLREGDTFNIVAYDSSVESFRPELEKFNDKTREQALGFVEGLYAGGGTAIHDALTTSLRQLQDNKRPSYVIFLTDGLPTVGERSEIKIAAAAQEANQVRARILNFGVGYDVNSRLLDRLGRENFGASEYVRPNEDIEAHVSKVYNRIKAPVLTDVSVAFEMDGLMTADGKAVNRVYPGEAFDLFGGEQVVMVGRYRKGGAAKVVLSGTVNDEPHAYDFGADLVKHSGDQSFAFVEKLWAMRRIGDIIDELDLHGANEELTKELVSLSTKHGILTSYTSFLADESSRPTELARSTDFLSNRLQTEERLERLNEAAGEAGVAQRAAKQFFRQADRLSTAPAAGAFGRQDAEQKAMIARGGTQYQSAQSDESLVTDAVRQIGNNALYRRGRILCTSETAELFTKETGQSALKLELEQLGDKVKVIERFSTEYFTLCTANTVDENRLLASQTDGEELLVNLRGQAYLIK
ncbi:MAG: VWA domain-containing protein [Planctomycetaceae bacterium]|nr:VWA domain-containing protein [Planctomycetaceae bacterium]